MAFEKILAWGVHLYTAMGLIAAAGIAVLLVRGGEESFRWAFVLMFAATVIDASDGWLAQRARVKEVTPGFDGRRLDDLIDFQTYTSLPLLLIWRAGILPEEQTWWLLLPLLASAYGFSQVNAKTADGFFLGFPSYWNIVAFYLYLLRLPAWASLGFIIGLSLLTFVPSRYLYPSQRAPFSRLTNLLGAAWAAMLLVVLARMPAAPRPLVLASLAFPVYYMGLSWVISLRSWRGRYRQAAE
jgi:phosphatidylcholine synthase